MYQSLLLCSDVGNYFFCPVSTVSYSLVFLCYYLLYHNNLYYVKTSNIISKSSDWNCCTLLYCLLKQIWLFPYPYGFCNPLQIHRMQINDIWYDIWYNIWYDIWYDTIQYDMIIWYDIAQFIMCLPIFLYEHRNISSIQNTVLLTVLLGTLNNQQSAKAKQQWMWYTTARILHSSITNSVNKFLLQTNMVAIWCERLSLQHKNSRTTKLKVWNCTDIISHALVHSRNVNHYFMS
jgi:hypothetical protein